MPRQTQEGGNTYVNTCNRVKKREQVPGKLNMKMKLDMQITSLYDGY